MYILKKIMIKKHHFLNVTLIKLLIMRCETKIRAFNLTDEPMITDEPNNLTDEPMITWNNN